MGMKVFTQVLTFTTNPVKITAANTQPSLCNTALNASYLYVEADPANTHDCFVGVSTLSSDGATGAISKLAIPVDSTTKSGTNLPNWSLHLPTNRIDLTQFSFQGTASEKLRVTFVIED